MLTAADLTRMRTDAERALWGTAVIQSQTYVSDGGGAGTVSWAAAGTVDCRIAPLDGREATVGERIAADAEYVATLPATAAVTTNSRLLIGGGTFNIAAIRDRTSPVTLRAEVRKES